MHGDTNISNVCGFEWVIAQKDHYTWSRMDHMVNYIIIRASLMRLIGLSVLTIIKSSLRRSPNPFLPETPNPYILTANVGRVAKLTMIFLSSSSEIPSE
jgi:hypothetical protein